MKTPIEKNLKSGTSRLVISSKKVIIIVGIMIIALVLIYQLLNLKKYPPVFIDEPWYANAAWNWLKTGRNYDSMHTGARDDIVWPLIGNVPLLISFAFFGLGLFQARLVSWLFGVLLIILITILGKRYFRTSSGILAALVLVLSFPFLQASHYARPDIFLATIGVLCFLLTLIAFETEKLWIFALTGLIISLSIDIHQNAILFGLGLITLYPINYGRQFLRKRSTWTFIGGGIFGLAYYGLLLVLPSTNTFINYYKFSLSTTHQLPLLSFNVIELIKSARAEIGRYHFFEHDLAFVLIGASFVYLAIRHRKKDLLLLTFTTTVFIGFILFLGNKHDIYAILLYPFFMLIVAETLISLFLDNKSFKLQRAFVGSMICLVITSGVIYQTREISSVKNYDYYAVTNEIRKVIPQTARVMGLPNWWLGLSDYDYRSNLSLTYTHFINGYSLEQGLNSIRPDFIILDSGWQGLLVDEGYFDSTGFDVFNMPRKEFLEFLKLHGEKILEFSNLWHGTIEIFRIRW